MRGQLTHALGPRFRGDDEVRGGRQLPVVSGHRIQIGDQRPNWGGERTSWWRGLVCPMASDMIWNIVDRRTRVYRWKAVNAIVEAVEHDNSCADADQAPEADVSIVVDYEQLEGVSVQQAVAWANQQESPVTLYLYDEGSGTTREEHFQAVGERF